MHRLEPEPGPPTAVSADLLVPGGRRERRSPGEEVEKPEHLSIVVPVFNEERRIEQTIRTIVGYLAGRWKRYEIIVSDDGSVDRTGAIVAMVQRDAPAIILLCSDRNRGKGSAVRRGVAASQGDLVLVTDADLATPIHDMENLVERIRAGADIAIGSRGLRESRLLVRQPLRRELLGRVYNVLEQLALLPGFSDTQCGFKLFRGPVARRLFAHTTIDGFAFDVEVLGLAARVALNVAEVPVRWSDMNESRVRPARDAFRMFRDTVRVTYQLRTSQYNLAALVAATGQSQAAAILEET